MIVLDQNGDSGAPLQSLEYIAHRGILGKIVLPITRYLRASNVMRYISPSQRILDIGCGDGYFLRRAPFRERYGVDKRLGDDVEQGLPFDSDFFDCVTMLAVIEHISDTGRLLEEIHRVLKPSGQLVLTTPKKAAEALIRIYVKDIDEEHEVYFDLKTISEIAGEKFDVSGAHTFIFGLNQAFCLTKRA